jgi:hypothetical protein
MSSLPTGVRGSTLLLTSALLALALGLAAVPAGAAAGVSKCTIKGTAGDDVLLGTAKADVICGLGGDDQLNGRGGNDRLYGGPGDDTIAGGRGTDALVGGRGADRLLRDAADRSDQDPDDTVAWRVGSSDSVRTVLVPFVGFKGVTIVASQGSDSYCTKDENYGPFTVADDPEKHPLTFTAKTDGSCYIATSENSWKFKFPGGGGEINMLKIVGSSDLYARCITGWVGATCERTGMGANMPPIVTKT